MRRLLQISCVLLSGFLLASCLGSDDDEVTLYDDMAITSFTLGTLNRYLHTTTAAGEDSVYKTTITGSSYTISIDQLKHEIYNRDSLPTGTDIAHVLCTIATKNSGMVLIKSATSDSLVYYSSTDSIDFSTERELRVYATDGSGFRTYKVHLNVRQQEESTVAEWKQLGADSSERPEMTTINTCWWNNRLVALCTQGEARSYAYTTVDGQTWQQLAVYDNPQDTGVPVSDVAVKDGCLFVLTTDQLTSYDADGQQTTQPANGLSRLLGASTTELYGFNEEGQLVASKDNGQSWTPETIDEDASLLPKTGVALVSFPYSTVANTDYVLLVGYDSETPRVWRKINEYDEGAAASKWVYMPLSGDNPYALPVLTSLSLVYFDGYVLAIGCEGIYVSRDQGITWKYNKNYVLPSDVGQTALSATTDAEGNLWLQTGDWQTWRAVQTKQ